MRGDYRGAEEVCLSILRRFPNNGTANGLLGDICAERGDLDQAADWYELALDIVPDSTAVRQKLLSVQQRVKEREAAATAKKLGLPTSRPRVALFVSMVIVVLVATGVAAFLLGRQNPRVTGGDPGVVQMPVALEPTNASAQGAGQQLTGAAPPARVETVEEQALLNSLSTSAQGSAKVLELRRDPRTGSLTIAFEPAADIQSRHAAASLSVAAFDLAADCQFLTIRAVQAGRVVHIADVRRDAAAATKTPEWQAATSGNADALANAVLSNEWPSRETSTTGPGSTPAPVGSSGTGP
jgi:hypothetical protein